MVHVVCMTYNHESFIRDAMNGFVIQDTSFPFVAVIIDDASTDNTGGVIKQYMTDYFALDDPLIFRDEEKDFGHLMFAQNKENKNCFFAVILLKENHYRSKKSKTPYFQEWANTKYKAICEGDDYWTNPRKLQQQISFLEQNPEYVICSHDFIQFFQDTLSFDDKSYYSELFFRSVSSGFIEYSLDTFFDRWWTQPLTCVYRNGDYIQRIPKESYQFFKDDIFYYYVLREGKGALLKDSMGVYRVHHNGTWSGESLIQRFERGSENAYSIYSVEGDVRAFTRINREELRILEALFNQRSYWGVIKRLLVIWKSAPKNHFHYVMVGFWEWLIAKFKRRFKIRNA